MHVGDSRAFAIEKNILIKGESKNKDKPTKVRAGKNGWIKIGKSDFSKTTHSTSKTRFQKACARQKYPNL